MMKVFCLVEGLKAPGGIENSLIKYIPLLEKEGIEMIVLSASGGAIVSELREVGIEVSLPEKDLSDVRGFDQELWLDFIEDNIKKHKPEILYTHQVNVTLSLLPFVERLPIVSAIHSRFIHLMGKNDYQDMKGMAREIDLFQAVGYVISEELRSLGVEGKISNVFSPVFPNKDLAKARVSPKNPQLIFVGRADDRKGLDVFLKALVIVKESFPLLRVVIIGNDGETERLLSGGFDKPLAHSLGVNESISWMGKQSHDVVINEMKKSDLLVSSSRQEGIPGVILEAHSLALPVVATQASAEAMNWGDAGMIVPRENPYLLAQAIISDLSDQKRKERALQNKEWVLSEYSAEKLLETLKKDFQKAQQTHNANSQGTSS